MTTFCQTWKRSSLIKLMKLRVGFALRCVPRRIFETVCVRPVHTSGSSFFWHPLTQRIESDRTTGGWWGSETVNRTYYARTIQYWKHGERIEIGREEERKKFSERSYWLRNEYVIEEIGADKVPFYQTTTEEQLSDFTVLRVSLHSLKSQKLPQIRDK